MTVEDEIFVSVDDHVVEPPDMFEGRLPTKYAGMAPKLVLNDHGDEAWSFDGRLMTMATSGSVAGRPPEEFGMDPTCYAEMRQGTWDVHERVRDMSAVGVLASMCFPQFPRFCGQIFSRTKDKALGLAVIRAYNDWHIDAWCGAYPDRLIPIGILPLWDPELMAAEVARLASRGCHAVTFSENPEKLGYPSIYSDHWDPFWSACTTEGTVVALHIGSSSVIPVTTTDAPMDTVMMTTPMNIYFASSDLLFSPVLRKFDGLRFLMLEGGIGWLPYFLERADFTYKRHHKWTGMDFGDRLPSEVFSEHCVACFVDDEVGIELRHRIGVDNICWEFDYPHSDCLWPDAPDTVMRYLGHIPAAERAAISHGNAMRLLQFDPFRTRPATQCTVGALRSEAKDVSTAPVSFGRRNTSGTAAGAMFRPRTDDGSVAVKAGAAQGA
jgi:predicted TIM-barrel fold metal-dependent hydrolase